MSKTERGFRTTGTPVPEKQVAYQIKIHKECKCKSGNRKIGCTKKSNVQQFPKL